VNPYTELAVDPDADAATIKTAYRRAAMANHPDRQQGNDDVEQFQIIALAYDILKDPDKRARFDATGETGGESPADQRLSQLLANCIDQGDWNNDIVEDLRRQVRHVMSNLDATNRNHMAHVSKMNTRLGRVKGLPQVDLMVQRKIDALETVIAANKVETKVLEGVLELLMDATDSQSQQLDWSA